MSILVGLWQELRSSNVCNVETVCIDENFSDFWVCIPSKITHAVVVVVRQNMRGVPVWTVIRDTSRIDGFWWKLSAKKRSNVEVVSINVNFRVCWVPIPSAIHMRW